MTREADAMERAKRLVRDFFGDEGIPPGGYEIMEHIARALTEYGDERAEAVRVQHASALQLQAFAAREARAAAIEEVIRFIEGGRFLHDDAPPKLFANEVVTGLRHNFRVIAPPQPEGGEG